MPDATDIMAPEQEIPLVGEGPERAPIRVAISIPTHTIVPAGFMYDLARLCAFSGNILVSTGQVDLSINMVNGTYIHTERQELAEVALMAECTHLLWLDSDMRFPRDLLPRLLMHNVPIVGVNYANRGMPVDYVATRSTGIEGEPPSRVATTEESTGLEEAAAIGFGAVLMKSQVFGDLGPPPWFRNEWSEEHGVNVGEDVYFCMKAREAGYRVWVDHDLSKEIAHIGQFEYKLDHAAAYQEEFVDGD